ncbi:MAG: TolC family outer membrane protein [Magnetococcales bacterium]|nr:TolC family outer membrane protein [Magnetococcales bacterium]
MNMDHGHSHFGNGPGRFWAICLSGAVMFLAGPCSVAQAAEPALPRDDPAQGLAASTTTGRDNPEPGQLAENVTDKHFMEQVRTAILRHPIVRSGALSERQAIQGIDVAKSALFPQVNGGFEGGPSVVKRPGYQSQTSLAPTAVLTINQLLFDAGETFDRVAAAEGTAKAERYQSMTVAQDFALRAVSAYMDVTRLKTQVSLAQDNLTRHEKLLGRVRERTEGGVGNQADLLRARGRIEEANAQLISAQGDYERILAIYQELFGTQPTHKGLPTVHPLSNGDVNLLVSSALQNNLELKSAQEKTKAAKFESDAEQASRFPKLTFEMEGRKYEVTHLGANDDHEVRALMKVNYPFYTGGKLEAQRERASLRHAQVGSDEQKVRLEVERQVRSAVTDVSSRTKTLASLELAVEADRQTVDNYSDLFIVGDKSLLDLLDAQRDYFNNSVRRINTRVQLDLSRFVLLQMTGNLLGFFTVEELPDHD